MSSEVFKTVVLNKTFRLRPNILQSFVDLVEPCRCSNEAKLETG